MITINKDGRSRSEKTRNEILDEVRLQWNSLSISEKQVALQVLEELGIVFEVSKDGFCDAGEISRISKIYTKLTNEHFDGPLVSVREFFLDEYYLGKSGKKLYPRWREDLETLFSGHYEEIIITGSIGGGKTTFCNMGLAREFYELVMLRDPQETFGLMADSEIILVCFNRIHKLAVDVTFGKIKKLIESSPFFKEINIKFETTRFSHRKKNITVLAASVKSSDVLGKDVYGGIIDETDFLEGSLVKSGSVSSFAKDLHTSITTRMKSRYSQAGVLPGKLFLSSSAREKGSFTNQRIHDARNISGVFVRDYAIWDVKSSDNFKKERFWVLVGNDRERDRILEDSEYSEIPEDKKLELIENGCRFLSVPIDFRSDFESNLEKSIQDLGGCVTMPRQRFFQLFDRIRSCIDETLFHPMASMSWKTGSDLVIEWHRITQVLTRKFSVGEVEHYSAPRRHPGKARHVHFDLSKGKTDPAGMAIGHIVDYIDVERRNKAGNLYQESMPLIEMDFMLRILPPDGGEIDFGEIRAIAYMFISNGYTISFGSCDSWQSHEMLTKLSQKGMKTKVISTWKDSNAFDCLKTAIYEGRLSYYNYPILIKELESLEKNNETGKIDHEEGGSKDVADAVAGVVWSLTNENVESIGIMTSIIERENDMESSEWIKRDMVSSSNQVNVPVESDGDNGEPTGFLFG